MYQLYSNNILYSFVCLYTFPDKIQPIRMQEIRCIFDGIASPFPSSALIVLSKIFTKLKGSEDFEDDIKAKTFGVLLFSPFEYSF